MTQGSSQSYLTLKIDSWKYDRGAKSLPYHGQECRFQKKDLNLTLASFVLYDN